MLDTSRSTYATVPIRIHPDRRKCWMTSPAITVAHSAIDPGAMPSTRCWHQRDLAQALPLRV